jgi:hypothetical protein
MNAVNTRSDLGDSMVEIEIASQGWKQSSRGYSFSVRLLLILLVMLVVVPAWGFAAYVAAQFAMIERQSIETAGRSNAQSVASSLNFRLRSLESAMAALALSNNLQAADLGGFYVEAKALANTQQVAVALVSVDGRQLLNTNAPFGTALPPAAVEAKYAQAISTRSV